MNRGSHTTSDNHTPQDVVWDLAVIGGGAAGLMAAIHAGRTLREGESAARVIVLDGAKRLGAKILVSGGGRCNVTHHAVDETAYAGASPRAVRKILRAYDVDRTVAFFADAGVELKRESTGKLFPVTDSARTVLDALVGEARKAGVEIRCPWRVERILREDFGFAIHRDPAHDLPGDGTRVLHARRVIVATGGKSLPKSGSDGHGYAMMRELGHTVTPRLLPALVPLLLPVDHPLPGLSGLSFEGEFTVLSGTGKTLARAQGSILCTHFGLSGPAVLDISRHYLSVREDDAKATLVLDLIPGTGRDTVERELRDLGGRTVSAYLRGRLPDRLAHAVCDMAGVAWDRTGAALTRDERRRLLASATANALPVTGDRGFRYAEVTAGGVRLSEVRLQTLESRTCPGLHLCGEICDVDGRIGGFNFQWAWSSGYVAGVGAARALIASG